MYTQCPECQTLFRVSLADLAHADGQVRCSRCDAVFDARSALHADADEDSVLASNDEPMVGDLFGTEAAPDDRIVPELEPLEPEPPSVATPDFDPATLPPLEDLPPLPAAGRPRPRRAPWIAVCALLALSLGAELVHANRDPLARDPYLGPMLIDAYRRFDVPIDEPVDLNRLDVQRTEVTSHPVYKDVLYLTATVTNTAEFAQPLPLLRVQLDDRWGEPVGARVFTPEEYLRNAPPGLARAEPGRTYGIALEVVDPGSEAVGYSLTPCLPAHDTIVCRGDSDRSNAAR